MMEQIRIGKPPRTATLWIDEPGAKQKIESDTQLSPLLRRHALEMVERGYTLVKGVHSKARCAEAIRSFRHLIERNIEHCRETMDAHGAIPRVVNVHACMPVLRDMFSQATLPLQIQDYLFGYRTALYTSLFFQRGTTQALHRDVPYFCTVPYKFYFGMWNALEDVDDQNGPLQVVEGSHRLADPDREAIARLHYKNLDEVPAHGSLLWDIYQSQVWDQAERQGLRVVEVHAEAGDVILWHPMAMHGGAPIKDPQRTRFSWVCHTTPDQTPVYHQDVFFNPRRIAPETPTWAYGDLDGARKMALFSDIDFNHMKSVPISDIQSGG